MAETVFGKLLVALRRESGLSQPQLADKARVSVGSVRDLEQGRRQPSWATVQALAEALGVEVTAFVDRPAKRPKPKAK